MSSAVASESTADGEVFDEVVGTLKRFIEQDVLHDDSSGLDATTPLLEWRILTSLTTMQVVAFIRSTFDVYVPPERIVGANFANLHVLARMVLDLQAERDRS